MTIKLSERMKKFLESRDVDVKELTTKEQVKNAESFVAVCRPIVKDRKELNMPDTTKPSWACDWCGKERFKGDAGFDARLSVKIESSGGYAFVLGCHSKEDKYVCCDCIKRVEQIMISSQN